MKNIKLGVIADDFTGASDAASFLQKSGNKTILLTGLDSGCDFDCDCIVVALKIRSVEPSIAIKEVDDVLDYFDKLSINNIYYKFCSTFDSTRKGNIGVVMDHLIQRYNTPYSILCPSLPDNGRTVKDGVLYVNGIKLSLSSMKNHPLNPMWDSYIPTLMKEQSKYPCFVLNNDVDVETLKKKTDDYLITNEHFYYVPDYETHNDALIISKLFKNLKVIGGGSGLLEYLVTGNNLDNDNYLLEGTQKAVIICGSCSNMSNRQVQKYKSIGPYITINADQLYEGIITLEDVYKQICHNLPYPTLIYSDGCEKELNTNDPNFINKSKLVEDFLSNLALICKNNNYNKIIVAGGETSGAAVRKLGYKSFYVGRSIAPGVPELITVENNKTKIILKSGNFGDENFFIKALEEK